MKTNIVHVALVATLFMQITSCTSSSSEQKAPAQQRGNDAIKMAPRESVELAVSYCDSQRELPVRKQVVTLGDTAIFEPTDATIYELKIKPFKNADGIMVMSMIAQWRDNVERRDVLFSRQILTQEGEISPQSVLKINGHNSCFTVTARSASNVAN
ncbi:hypothetical protein [Pseudomonas kitaguniensis]|uniref:hypothetical protein n=1 Tax=Pseudomonas kitaguniensis TaxID=2607908 RepID=UPI003BA136B4